MLNTENAALHLLCDLRDSLLAVFECRLQARLKCGPRLLRRLRSPALALRGTLLRLQTMTSDA
jgi:hypothetical protein